MSTEEDWMSKEVTLVVEAADADIIEFLSDETSYGHEWAKGMERHMREHLQFPHRVDGFFERVFNACIKAGKED